MSYDNDMTRQSSTERTQHYTAALQLKDDVLQLQIRWKRYTLPVQERLVLLLTRFGFEAAEVATEALERQEHSRQFVLALTPQSTVSVSLWRGDSYSWLRMFHRCIEASRV